MSDFHQELKAARRALGMTQSALAAAVDCKQSAISMLERGRMGVIARPTLEKIAEILGVTVSEEAALQPKRPAPTSARAACYCPTFDCPSNLPYVVSGELFFLPVVRGQSKHCLYCGELLESRCPACGTAAGPGACCMGCGSAYVSAEGLDLADPATWADRQRERIQQIIGLLGQP